MQGQGRGAGGNSNRPQTQVSRHDDRWAIASIKAEAPHVVISITHALRCNQAPHLIPGPSCAADCVFVMARISMALALVAMIAFAGEC